MLRRQVSYPMNMVTRGWPGEPTCEIKLRAQMDQGDKCNTAMVTFFNHYGTHMDSPKHYNNNGKSIYMFPLETFFFEKPLLLDIPKGKLEKVYAKDLEPYAKELASCDLLMVRTGFSPLREKDPDVYFNEGPAISLDACKYLVENYLGSLKAIAVDFLSLACPQDTVDGDEAHRWLCGSYHDGNIFIIEDVKMDEINKAALKRAAAVPLFVEGIDSAPVTMWVEEE